MSFDAHAAYGESPSPKLSERQAVFRTVAFRHEGTEKSGMEADAAGLLENLVVRWPYVREIPFRHVLANRHGIVVDPCHIARLGALGRHDLHEKSQLAVFQILVSQEQRVFLPFPSAVKRHERSVPVVRPAPAALPALPCKLSPHLAVDLAANREDVLAAGLRLESGLEPVLDSILGLVCRMYANAARAVQSAGRESLNMFFHFAHTDAILEFRINKRLVSREYCGYCRHHCQHN